MKTIDVCGISCPEPLLRLKEALKTETSLILLTDCKGTTKNCVEYAEKQGFSVKVEEKGGIFNLNISK